MGARPGFNVDLATDRSWNFRDWSWIFPDTLVGQGAPDAGEHRALLLVPGLRAGNTTPHPMDFSAMGQLAGQGMMETMGKVSPVNWRPEAWCFRLAPCGGPPVA